MLQLHLYLIVEKIYILESQEYVNIFKLLMYGLHSSIVFLATVSINGEREGDFNIIDMNIFKNQTWQTYTRRDVEWRRGILFNILDFFSKSLNNGFGVRGYFFCIFLLQ